MYVNTFIYEYSRNKASVKLHQNFDVFENLTSLLENKVGLDV